MTTRFGPPHWLACRRRRADAGFRLYCFPHSGGSTGEYVRWADELPTVEVHGIQFPGRGGRIEETPFTDMQQLVYSLVGAVEFRPPFAFFGHSFGALVAFETTRALSRTRKPRPHTLFVSAQRPPHLPHPHPLVPDADDEVLLEELGEDLGSLAADARDDPELVRLVLSGYRADLTILRDYRGPSGTPVDCPIVAVGGDQDTRTADELGQWRDHTTGTFQLRMLPGGHFYFRGQRPALLHIVTTALADRPPPKQHVTT